eukprot:TRINITY_DN98688_c0_g1_i1.p1 TRINITY_DN98688_c0_g1~~TRINITY_DN98688_c0_g1_i1.p1  ORF type:complete len:143 (+),score=13.43 TRINITY_DN98688_c0_g1_i1:3-431(+)
MIKTDNAVCVRLLKQLELCQQSLKGSWGPHMWAALILQLLESKIGSPADLQILQQHAQQSASFAGLAHLITDCSIRRCFDNSFCCVTLILKHQLDAELGAVLRCLESAGAELKHGPAPPRLLERRISAALTRADQRPGGVAS